MKKIIIVLMLSFFCFPGVAQKKILSIEEAVLNARTTLAPKKINQLAWIKGTSEYAYVNSGDSLLRGQALGSKGQVVLTLNELNQWIRAAKIDTLKKFPIIKWTASNTFEFKTAKNMLTANLSTHTISAEAILAIPDDAGNLDKAPGTPRTAYTKDDFNLYIDDGGQNLQITTDGSKDLFYGRSVHQDEFGIIKGTFWSPVGNKLAFYRMDQSMIPDYPIGDYSVKPVKDSLIKYPFAGNPSHHVTVGVYNINTKKINYLKTGEPVEQYLTNIAWSPDEKIIYIAVVNRAQDHMWLRSYDASTGDYINTLFEEADNKYVEPLQPMHFLPNNPEQFIWQSRRDGYYHFYLYDLNGKLIRQLTKGNWEVISEDGFNLKGDKLYFSSTINGAINRDYCSVEIQTGKVTRITSGDGVHTCTKNESGEFIIDNFSSLEIPRQVNILKSDGKKSFTLLNAENPLSDYQVGTTKIFTLKSDIGDDLYCRMITPPDFDPAKKYPVFVYVYGGPHVQLITNTWLGGADLWDHVLAQKGYIVFTLDNHGSGNRGKAFEQVVFRKLGTIEMQDQLTGVNYLKSLPYVDEKRLGIDGWSYGGFMTMSLMTRKPGIFKVAVAGGPVIDWSFYEIMYTERYMDTPQENKEGYDLNNLMNYIDNLQGKMMIIHGTSDKTVVWQQSLRYIQSAVTKGKQLDYFVYPGHLHNVLGKERAHLITKIINYFTDNL